jgi:hypothetical protein
LHTHIFFQCVTFSVYEKQEERGEEEQIGGVEHLEGVLSNKEKEVEEEEENYFEL